MQVERNITVSEKTSYIRLTQGLFTEVDTESLIWLSNFKWYAKKNTSKNSEHGKYYAARSIKVNRVSITIYMHREIMDCPQDKEVDHKNDNSLMNKRDNLVVCSRSEHMNKVYTDKICYRL